MLKTSLLINELTCRIGNAILLVMIYCLSAIHAHAISLEVTGCVSTIPRVRVHYFARYLMVMVHIRTLGSIVPVVLAGSLVWWDSP